MDVSWIRRPSLAVSRTDDRGSDRRPLAPLIVDVRHLGGSGLGIVEELARLALAARRAGRGVRVVGVDRELAELIALAGLARVLRHDPAAWPWPPGVSRGAVVARTAGRDGPYRGRM